MFFLFFLFFTWTDTLVQKMNYFLEEQKVRPFNGVLLIADQDSVLYQKAKGLANETQEIDINRKFIIASVSKQFTAAMVLKNVDAGKIRLEDPLGKFFPDIKFAWKNKVTLHHLLSHTSGLRSLYLPLAFISGSKFEYNNLNYILLGKILEIIHQKTYNQITKDFLNNLKLTESDVISNPALVQVLLKIPHFAVGYYEDKKSKMKKREIFEKISFNPTGGLISTVHDLWRWNNHLHQNGVLNKETYQKMITPYLERKYRYGKLGYGYGIHISEVDGITEIFHGGFLKGYISSLYYYPEFQITIAILENRSWWQGKPNRVYYFHDYTRTVVRQYIQQLRNKSK